jgi:hypothetical protein
MSRPHPADGARLRALLATLLLWAPLAGCGTGSLASWTGFENARREQLATWTRADDAPAEAQPVTPIAAELEGRFSLLTYNVAGLPQALSPSSPRDNIPLMSPLLDAYDVAVVQEDFSYHEALVTAVHHPYRSRPMLARSFVGDGLSLLSRLAFEGVHRVRWERCNGFVSSAADCLADKGFSFSTLDLAPDVALHLYNLHADAGSGELDVEARAHNFAQLAGYIRSHSDGQAVVVAGDTNLMTAAPGDAQTLARFLEALGLRDACRALGCWHDEPIDRVVYRGSARITLAVTRLWHDTRFVDAAGLALSDHPAVGAELTWSRRAPSPLMAHLGSSPAE